MMLSSLLKCALSPPRRRRRSLGFSESIIARKVPAVKRWMNLRFARSRTSGRRPESAHAMDAGALSANRWPIGCVNDVRAASGRPVPCCPTPCYPALPLRDPALLAECAALKRAIEPFSTLRSLRASPQWPELGQRLDQLL